MDVPVGTVKKTVEGFQVVNFNVLAWGANQHWDYSSLVLSSGEAATRERLDGSQSAFPSTNWFVQNETSTTSEYREYHANLTDSVLMMMGNRHYTNAGNDTSTWNYVSGYTQFEFPLNYFDNWNTEYTEIFNDGAIADTQLHKNVSQVDGWGQISTPFGTYDCLRIVAARTQKNPLTTQWEALDNTFTWLADSIGIVFQVEGYHFDQTAGANVGIVRYYDPTPDTTATTGLMVFGSNIVLEINPNPVQNSTTITFNSQVNRHVEISIFDHSGRLVEQLMNKFESPGKHELIWNTENHESGIYYAVVRNGDKVESHKLVVQK